GGPRSADAVARHATELGLSTPAAFKHFSEWLLSSGITEEVAIARLPYLPDGAIAERIAEWRSVGVVRAHGGRLHAEAPLRPLLRAILDARAEAADAFWSGNDALEVAAGIVASVVDGLDPGLLVAHDHAQVPLPDHQGLAFHQQLTTLRYARAAAHVDAWKAVGLERDDVLALSSLWRGEPVTRGTTRRLAALGLAEGDRITDEGRLLRSRIEDDTDARNAPVFAGVDGPGLVAVLSELGPA
ncbi:MAG: hypothetical protein HKN46_07155, partial [Acidimicrobiia bacterium]|nr:hypothetical protein [Acidimicrobiia bacterium]